MSLKAAIKVAAAMWLAAANTVNQINSASAAGAWGAPQASANARV